MSTPAPMGGGPDWEQLLYFFFVGTVGVFVDWLRRRMNRYEDDQERKWRKGDHPHRRWDDGSREDHHHHRETDEDD